MPITHEFAKSQIARLECLPGRPQTSAGLKEIIAALVESASDEAHATAVITAFCESDSDRPRWPVPGEIRRQAREFLGPSESPPCARCNGAGYVSMDVELHGVLHGVAQPCGCLAEAKRPGHTGGISSW